MMRKWICFAAVLFSLARAHAAVHPNKVDFLFVIDNSGSMQTAQNVLAEGSREFFRALEARGIDYRIAVTTTDAYKDLFQPGKNSSQFKDGSDQTTHTGVRIVTPSTPDASRVFAVNLLQGVYGSGDERAFQSMAAALQNPLNAGFLRWNAYLHVVILSDEDDGSHDRKEAAGPNDPLHDVAGYAALLEKLKGTKDAYAVSSIAIYDSVCLDQSGNTGRRFGTRYAELAIATNGGKFSICSIKESLSQIAGWFEIISRRK